MAAVLGVVPPSGHRGRWPSTGAAGTGAAVPGTGLLPGGGGPLCQVRLRAQLTTHCTVNEVLIAVPSLLHPTRANGVCVGRIVNPQVR